MDISDIPRNRLHNQKLLKTDFKNPGDVVRWLGAVQSQDYAGAKWAVGQRTNDATDNTIEQAFTNGSILRTHMMRPTWHFVAPMDIRWIQKLTASRVKIILASNERKLGMDAALFRRSNRVIEKALQGGKQLTRTELGTVLEKAGIPPVNGQRLGHFMIHAELDCIICSGPRRGKQFTYALLEERAPQAKDLDRDEALVELTRRYFTSHGPATVQDFAWWSGLTIAEVKRGLEMVRSQLIEETIEGNTFWFAESSLPKKDAEPVAFLLPNYDEYGIAYRDHSLICDFSNEGAFIFSYVIVLNGQIVGNWKRTIQKNEVLIQLNPAKPLLKVESRAVVRAAERYAAFIGLPVMIA